MYLRTPYKKVLLAICWLLLATLAGAQGRGVHITGGAQLYVSANTKFCFWGDTLQLDGKLLMQDSTAVFNFKGRAWRNSPTAYMAGGLVVMNDTSLQAIVGAGALNRGPAFSRLAINNGSGVYLMDSHLRVDSAIVFTNGILLTGTHDLILGAGATATHNDSSFASTYEGGAVVKKINGNEAFTFPVGTTFAATAYNPLHLQLYGARPANDAYVRVSLADSVHSAKSGRHHHFAHKYWQVALHHLAVDSARYTATFSNHDRFTGDTALIAGSHYQNNAWSYAEGALLQGRCISGILHNSADLYAQDPLLQTNIKALLEGAWNGAAMRTTLASKQLLPLRQPYDAAPFNYKGTEARTSMPHNAVDWVLVELRRTPADEPVARSAGILLADGNIVDGFGNSPLEFAGVLQGEYYVVVQHRNHLAVMSAAPVPFPRSSAYDFTTSVQQAMGDGTQMADVGNGVFALRGGNIIPDKQVAATGPDAANDLAQLYRALGKSTNIIRGVYRPEDVNMDGEVRATGLPPVNDYHKLLRLLGGSMLLRTQGF